MDSADTPLQAVIDAVTSNIPITPADHPQEVLQGLQRILSSSRGGNKALLAALYLKMAPIVPHQSHAGTPMVMGRVEEPMDDQDQQQQHQISDRPVSTFGPPGLSPNTAWVELEEILATHPGLCPDPSCTDRAASQQQAGGGGGAWTSMIDFGSPLNRSPSPMTRVILEQFQASGGDEFLAGQLTSWNEGTP
jgi:hypothetical protein